MTTPSTDPAEHETEERMHAVSSAAASFDRVVESSLQLQSTVRVAVVVIAVCAVMSMAWSVFATYAMRGTIIEIRVMLQAVLDAVAKGHP
jgi:hypothetical protein